MAWRGVARAAKSSGISIIRKAAKIMAAWRNNINTAHQHQRWRGGRRKKQHGAAASKIIKQQSSMAHININNENKNISSIKAAAAAAS